MDLHGKSQRIETRTASYFVLIVLLWFTVASPAVAQSGSASNQLCSAAGQGAGCIGGFHPQPMSAPIAMTGTSSYGAYQANVAAYLWQPFIQTLLMSQQDGPAANRPILNIDPETEKKRKKKLKRIAWLADDARDSLVYKSAVGGQFDPNAASWEALIAGAKAKSHSARYPDHFKQKQNEIKQCIDSGKCAVIGNPESAKRLGYRQDGNTCVIATQAEVLRDVGRPFELHFSNRREMIDPVKMSSRQLEDTLYSYAKDKGYFMSNRSDGGIPIFSSGSILKDAGYKVETEYHLFGTGIPDIHKIPAALQQGHYVAVWVEARDLWRTSAQKGNHSVLVTGAVVQGSEVKGVYINDTGTSHSGEGKGFLIPTQYFENSWRDDHGHLLDITPPTK